MLPRVIRKSTRLLAVSKFTKNEILNMFQEIDENKIIVTCEGVDGFFNKIPHDELSDLKNRYKIVKPYLLTVSTIEPRKNLSNVLKAFAQIKNKIDHDLLLVGAWGWYSNDLINLIEALKIKKRIKFLGFLNREELRLMYNSAEVFLYPSLYEGFGLPLLEAMACGCPVLTSNISALPEVAGDAAITVNPHCVEEISDGIITLVNDKEKREALSKKGLTRAKMFSWEKCAQETIKAYSEMLCSF
jgi:glycosyltransferase involved in cell wall biosynthesis